MDIKVTIDMPALDRLVDAIMQQTGGADVVHAATEARRGPGRPPKGAETPAAATPEADRTVTLLTMSQEDLVNTAKTAAMKLQTKSGRDALIALLGEFGAQNISAIPADRLAEFAQTANTRAA